MKKTVDLSKAHAFWGLAQAGKLMRDHVRAPYILGTRRHSREVKGRLGILAAHAKPVKVYLVVEE